jgi:YHS domain-containing protein
MPVIAYLLLVIPVMGTALTASQPASEAPKDDGLDPNVPRDVIHYNLDKQGLALQGYDPVAYFPEGGGKPAKGDAALAYAYRGATYRFASPAHLERFRKNPGRYEPAHGGWCSSAMADGGRKVEIDPKAFRVTKGRLFLFYTSLFQDARTYWDKDEPANTVAADRQWKRISGEEPRRPVAEDPTGDPSNPDLRK